MNITRNFVTILYIFITVFLILFTIKVETYRILGIFPLSFKSHNIFSQALMTGLAKRGHQVDVISYHEPSNPPKNYNTIINLSNISYAHAKGKFNSFQEPVNRNRDIIKLAKFDYGLHICNLMSHEKLQNLIKNPPKDPPYDIFITQGTSTNCFFGFGPLLKVPVVSVSPSLEFSAYTRSIGNPLYTSFYLTALSMKSKLITFWDRVENTLKALINEYRFNSYTENQSEAMKKYLNPNISSIREVERMVSLFIVNTYYSIQGVRPTIPGFIEVGGLHIKEDDFSLPIDLKQWMDESIDGVVLLSFGSLVPIETLPNEICLSLFSSFAKLAPMRILMKVTDGFKFPFELPKNVLGMTWTPQISILRNNNTRLFITHGGVHSIMEAIYFGVPVIGIPIYYDQHQNIEIVVNKGMGLQLELDKITEDSLDKALSTIINDSKFREAAKYHSRIFRDRELSPMDTATFWIEYIVRNGIHSLRSPAIDMHWWQIDLLDVYIFLMIVMIILFYITLIIVNLIRKHYCRKNVKLKLKRK